MIPQSLMSPPSLKNEFSNESERVLSVFEKCNEKKLNSSNEGEESIVQWKQTNIKDGLVIVDEAQLTKLIKREPIEKYYKLEQEPFAKGLFTSVRKCRSLDTGESYAAKFTNRDRYGEDCSGEIYHEIALLSLCGSAARVIQIHDVFENVNEIIIVMEYAPGGDLQTIIDENLVPFESDVMSFIRQTVEGLDYLHRRKIAHLDIKPQNIVMMGDYPHCQIKLCDFEISRVILEGKDIRELLGTPDYVAPEILHYDPITLAADMWSLGVTTYVLLTGYSPFGGETDQETFCNISRGEVDFPPDLFKDVSNEAIDFIKCLLVKNPKARLTASSCLKHPWLNSSKQEAIKSERIKTANAVKNNDFNFKKEKEEKEAEEEEEEEVDKVINNRDASETEEKEIMEPEYQEQNEVILRKYLSKSREALFDKVVQKHNNYNQKKATIKNNRFRRTRMCESQISLFSKSQEKLLAGETFHVPSKSIEKLYGLRSLSKSQEVLNLYKIGGLLTSQENLNLVSELIKSRENLSGSSNAEPTKYRRLMRATTADLGALQQKTKPSRIYSCSSTTSLASFTANMPEDEDEDEDGERADSVFELNSSTKLDAKSSKNVENFQRKNESNEEKNPAVMKEIEKLETRKNVRNETEGDEEDEPRFTVAQLITAYNKHQEIVTKTSLEVTMSAQEKKIKIPPIIPYKSESSFPTGPTALRLFIPDIDLVSMPKKFTPKYKMRFPEEKTTNKEKISSPVESEPIDSFGLTNPSSNLSQINLNAILSDSKTSGDLNQLNFVNQKELNRKKPETGQNINQEVEQLVISVSRQSPNKYFSTASEISRSFNSTGNTENQEPEDGTKLRSPTPNRKHGVSRSIERSPSVTRKSLTVVKSPVPQRKTSVRGVKPEETINSKKFESSSQYKIVGIGEKNANRYTSGVSYKIEFDSPVVKRKFPTRNVPTKGTISSNLKARETIHRARK